MKSYKTIIWDWNGTLADDLMASLQATNDTLARRNMPPLDVETGKKMDKDRFRQGLGGFMESYAEVLERLQK